MPGRAPLNSRKVDSKGIRILLVDDREAESAMIERCFHERSRRGDIVTHFLGSPELSFDPEDLIAELQRSRYDCVLIDLSLPADKDGISLSKTILQQVASPPPIILLADTVGPSLRARATMAGVTNLLDRNHLTLQSLRDIVDIAVHQRLDAGQST